MRTAGPVAPAVGARSLLAFLLALVFTLSSFAVAPPAEAIVGGTAASIDDYPFMAALNEDEGQICGASLIAPQWVLSAAHCVRIADEPERYSFTFGRSHLSDRGGETITAAEVIVHPLYDSTGVHDVALYRLERSSTYEPLRVAHPVEDRALWEPDDIATVIGYGGQAFRGFLADYQLREVDVPVVSDDDCETFVPGVDPETEVCAGELHGTEDSCQGDSGGPLIVRDEAGAPVQMGVVSWGNGCGFPTQYGVYSRVGDHTLYDWIQQQLTPSAPVEDQPTEFETVTVPPRGFIAGSSAVSATETAFSQTCDASLTTQGVDGYVWELPEGLAVPGAIAQLGGYSPVGWPIRWDLDLAFYAVQGGKCALLGDLRTSELNERAAIPAGTQFVVATAFLGADRSCPSPVCIAGGADISVELTVDIPIIEDPVVATALELSPRNPTQARFRDSTEFAARLTDASGTPLEGKPVRFAIVDADGTIVQIAAGSPTDAEGVSATDLTIFVPAGDYTIRASFMGSPDEYLSSETEAALSVLTADSVLSVEAAGVGNKRTVSVTLTEAKGGVPIGARVVEVFADCESLGTLRTNERGTATMKLMGRHRARTVEFSGLFAGDQGDERYYGEARAGSAC